MSPVMRQSYDYVFKTKLKTQEEQKENPRITIKHRFVRTSVFPMLAQFFPSSYFAVTLYYHVLMLTGIISCLFPLLCIKLHDYLSCFILLSLRHTTLSANVGVSEPYFA